MIGPKFSVVIPTRNRADTLESSLKTCLNQDFEDYEIVVCDNSTSEKTLDLIGRINSKKIKYLPPVESLAMSANWERAVAAASGEYITVLGDDDGLMPYALRELDRIVQATKSKAILWQRGIYTWPTVSAKDDANFLIFSLSRTISKVNGLNQLKKVASYRASGDSLPMIYCSAIHRDLISMHREKVGCIFPSIYPDIYSGFAFGFLSGDYISASVPFSIAGLSHASNGVATLAVSHESKNSIASDFDDLNSRFGYSHHPWIPDVYNLQPVHIADSFLHAQAKLFPELLGDAYSRKDMAIRFVKSISETDPVLREAMRRSISLSLSDDLILRDWFDNEVQDFPPAPLPRQRTKNLGFDGSRLAIDTSGLNVSNIFEAVNLVAAILGFEKSVAYNLPSLSQAVSRLKRS